jgi:hypothetical protein
MERRRFISGLSTLVAGIALEKAIPFGRVWSFPKEIKAVNCEFPVLLQRRPGFPLFDPYYLGRELPDYYFTGYPALNQLAELTGLPLSEVSRVVQNSLLSSRRLRIPGMRIAN